MILSIRRLSGPYDPAYDCEPGFVNAINNTMATNPKVIEGIYKQGKVELLETPDDISESRVIVTFIPEGSVGLAGRGIDESNAADLRARLQTFAEDWERPEMGAYDAL